MVVEVPGHVVDEDGEQKWSEDRPLRGPAAHVEPIGIAVTKDDALFAV